ncbi:nucleotidyltransferase family protein [Lentibacter sp. XHP0401]|uniref:nucleotidyltransferase family protein n=1 Tax=Lentibacter sp. XHP0401 TaxID=2984334 RepID=UPI0021E7AD53|nr:nucleotidyltransferase family protein [Lentibacter sp. XHP0401]MCV2892640.1 nucleotidyltransferase family protein [Lentibacter sp. XHP0401]
MRNSPRSLMIFAAGFGTRMGALTAHQPKPMVKVAGRPLIDHTLTLAAPLGLNTVVNLHYLPHVLEAHLAGSPVKTITESPDILETGGGLKNALPLLGNGPAFTLNSDALWRGPNPLEALQAAWNPEEMDALLLLIPLQNALGHKGTGDFVLSDKGQLTRGAGLVYSGAQIIKPELTKAIPERSFSLNLVWDNLLQDGRLFGLSYTGQWCDVGSPEGITRAERMLDDTSL